MWRKGSPRELLRGMSLEEKAGQVLMVGFGGKDAIDAKAAVEKLKAGGLIYFARNTGDVCETAALSRSLQQMAESATGIPLLISADQEGGIVSRLTQGLPDMPGPMALGAAGDEDLAFRVSRGIGVQLRAAGINVDLAPVLDVNDNPKNPVIGVRSFGSDPGRVAALGAAAVKGFLASGIAPVGKHFMGHGNTSVDSHLDLPVLDKSEEELWMTELRPFVAAIGAGLPAIMTAHIVFGALDPDHPATMSQAVLEGLLRQRMGFQGVILTDCLEMNAVSMSPGTPRAAVLALKAGADLLLISHTWELQEEALRQVVEAVQRGEVPESRLDEAVFRVLSLKRSLGIPNPLEPSTADSEELRALSREAHRRSITLVRSAAGALPGNTTTTTHTLVVSATSGPGTPDGAVGAGTTSGTAAELARCLRQRGIAGAREVGAHEALDIAAQGRGGAREALDLAAQAPGGAVRLILLVQNAWKDDQQLSTARALLQAFPDAIVVAVRDPYDARVLPQARTFLCTYGPRPGAMEALGEVLTGASQPGGRLPVTLDSDLKLHILDKVRAKRRRLIVGLMSGTSADGVDTVLCEIEGCGTECKAEVKHLTSVRYPAEVRDILLGDLRHLTAEEVARLDFLVADVFSKAALLCLREAGVKPEDVDAVSSHGQTLVHLPRPDHEVLPVRATLQVGDISVIAQRTGILTVGDFRPADMAAGGQGAPLVPYADFVLFTHPERGRVIQNIGGIANCTYLPPGCQMEDVLAFDTGPGNMVVDALMRMLTDGRESMDEDGAMASRGEVHQRLLEKYLDNPYFRLPPPKSTGREDFGTEFAATFLRSASDLGLTDPADIMATASELTVKTISMAYRDFVLPRGPVHEVIVGGGGSRNPYFMKGLAREMPAAKILRHEDLGIPDKAKEALAFAILGNELIAGRPNNVPSATGASRQVVMGKIAFP